MAAQFVASRVVLSSTELVSWLVKTMIFNLCHPYPLGYAKTSLRVPESSYIKQIETQETVGPWTRFMHNNERDYFPVFQDAALAPYMDWAELSWAELSWAELKSSLSELFILNIP
jgi:hypothetical protein